VTLKDMLSKVLEMDVSFHRATLLGNMDRRYFPRLFERRDELLYLGELL